MEEEMRELGRSMRVTSRIRLSLKRDDRWECALLSRSSYVRMYVCTFGSHYEDTMGPYWHDSSASSSFRNGRLRLTRSCIS